MKHAPAAIPVHSAHSLQLHDPKVRDWLRSICEGLTQDPWVIVEALLTRSLDDGSTGLAKRPGAYAEKSSADAAKLLARRIVLDPDTYEMKTQISATKVC